MNSFARLALVSLLALGSLASCLFARSLSAAETKARPNILFIYADDQSYKSIGCYGEGPAWVKTPNIDAIARSGVRFQRAYLGAWCMPSRASILTGRLQHGVKTMRMEGEYPGSEYDPAQCPFVPAQFRKQGYQTAQIGKWHTGTDTGFGRDWDYQVVWNRPAHPENAGHYYYKQLLTINGVEQPELEQTYSTDHYTNLAVDYIQGKNRTTEKPWYLWLCYGAIHGPTTPAKRHIGTQSANKTPLPEDILGPWPGKPKYLADTSAWVRTADGSVVMRNSIRAKSNFDTIAAGKTFDSWLQQYNECNMAVDEGVGRVMEALKASGQLENTLVVYTADQGYGLGEHGFNQKVAPYDATLASSLIISYPGHIPAGEVGHHAVNSPDIVDYLCREAAVEIPWKMHGRDIRPLLKDPTTTTWKLNMLITHTARQYGDDTNEIPTDERLTDASKVPWYAMLRHGKLKYIRNLVAGETEELYDLDSDPEELTNLADESAYAQTLIDLRAQTIAELKRTDAGFVEHMPVTKQMRGGKRK